MRRFHVPNNVAHTYRIFPPSGRKAFRVMAHSNGKFTTVADSRIAAINSQFRGNVLTKNAAREQIELVVESLYRADGVKFTRVSSNSANEKILEKYLAEIISPRKTKKTSKDSLADYLARAVRAVGEHSIASADIAVLQAAIDESYPDQRQRQLVTYLNAVLRWLGRKDKLQLHAKEAREVQFIPLNKLEPILEKLPSRAWQVAVEMAANSGLRIGELFALDSRSRMGNGLRVDWQIERDGTRSRPKRGKRRTVASFQRALALFDEWLEVKSQISLEERNQAATILRKACKEAYPNRPEWNLKFHDLRHSYAVACCDKGMSLDWLARQIGDRLETTEEFYAGFIQSEAAQDAAYALLNN